MVWGVYLSFEGLIVNLIGGDVRDRDAIIDNLFEIDANLEVFL